MTPSSDSALLSKSSRNSGKHFTYYGQFITKDTNKQPDEEVTGSYPGGSTACRSFGPHRVWGVPLPPTLGMWMHSTMWKLETPSLGFYGGSITQAQLIKSLATSD